MMGAGVVALVGVAVLVGRGKAGAAGEPFRPADPAQVLEHLPAGASDPSTRELAALRKQLEADPTNVNVATTFARRNIEEGRARSDPRYLGHAQAALAPWWNEPSPPPSVLLLRATIRQSVHEFDSALKDLDQLLALAPGDAQAWLTRSIVLSVRGDYAEALRSCGPLARLAGELVTAQCVASVESQTGHAKQAYLRLSAASERANIAASDRSERAWIASSLGEIAIRAGDDAAGEARYKEALALNPSDAYTLAASADLLLDEGRAREAMAPLRDRENDDALLLHLALAEAAAGDPSAAKHVEMLGARFAASQARGDVVHRREHARFQLALRHDPKAALALARANWDVQKEPWDARIFLESALAAGDPSAANVVAEFLTKSGAEEPRLVALVRKVRGQ
jgi:tetratricopeptide (TPR) repeat protein